jgi:hypothetical protein
MPAILQERVQAAITVLQQAHYTALQPFVERKLPHQPVTVYGYAADELNNHGISDYQWDWSSLNILFYGLMALPNHADFADLILWTLELLPGQEPFALPITLFDEYLMPDDTWATELLVNLIPPAIAPATVPYPQSQTDITAALVQAHALGAIRALGIIKDAQTDAQEVLLAALLHHAPDVSAAAAYALGELRIIGAQHLLIERICQNCMPAYIQALGLFNTTESSSSLRHLLSTYQNEQAIYYSDYSRIVAALLRALARSGDQQAIPYILPFLAVPDERVNLEAAMALSKLGDQRERAFIYEVLENGDEDADEALRQDVAQLLVTQGDPKGWPVLLKCYQDKPDYLLLRLSRSGEPGDIPFLKWVAATDFSQTGQGWSRAAVARYAMRRIEARQW